MGNALEQIRQGKRLDDVVLGHGYESHSGFREAFGRFFGRPPKYSAAMERDYLKPWPAATAQARYLERFNRLTGQ